MSVDLRTARHASGLTVRQVARAAGVSTSTVTAYERGDHRNPATLHRLAAVIRVGADSPIHRHRLVTIASAAVGIRVGLRDGCSPGDLLRMVRESRSNSKFLRNDADRAAFYAQPPSTGDARWDAMLAGVTEMDALRTGHDVPPWCRGHHLPCVWFVGSTRAYTLGLWPTRRRHSVIEESSSTGLRLNRFESSVVPGNRAGRASSGRASYGRDSDRPA